VDHGTAFDIAGKNIARVEPMKNAIRMAVRLAQTQNQVLAAQR
jgi:4-hydroxy-L-threonine phosphate dehydrogenase PdxA